MAEAPKGDERTPKKRVNTVRKGQKKEVMCRKELKAAGWTIFFKSIRWRFGTIDYAELFDVVAGKGKLRKHVSCKHYGKGNLYSAHQEEIKRFAEEHGQEHDEFELWIWKSPRWYGRGKDKKWFEGGWIKIIYFEGVMVVQDQGEKEDRDFIQHENKKKEHEPPIYTKPVEEW